MLNTIKRRKADWIDRILRRNCLLNHVLEAEIEGTKRRRRRRKQLLDVTKKTRRYWKLEEEALDRTLRRTRVGSSYE